jgi:hypothetical protein
LLAGVECNVGVEPGLALLPKKERIKKTVREYRLQAPRITTEWVRVKQACSQASDFEQTLLTKVAPPPAKEAPRV